MPPRIANKPAARKRGNPNWKKGGPSPNPQGAPKRGESWAEIIKRFGEMTPSEAAQVSLELSKRLLNIGEGITLKQAVVLRVYDSLLFEPQPGLLNAFMERAEGKMMQPIEVENWRSELEKHGVKASDVFERLVAAVAAEIDRAGSSGSDGGSDTAQGG